MVTKRHCIFDVQHLVSRSLDADCEIKLHINLLSPILCSKAGLCSEWCCFLHVSSPNIVMHEACRFVKLTLAKL